MDVTRWEKGRATKMKGLPLDMGKLEDVWHSTGGNWRTFATRQGKAGGRLPLDRRELEDVCHSTGGNWRTFVTRQEGSWWTFVTRQGGSWWILAFIRRREQR